MAKVRQNVLNPLVLVVSLFLPLAGVWAQSDQAFVQYRQKLMKSHGAHMGSIGDILKYKLPYQNHIVTHARNIEMTTKLIGEAFKKEITAGKTDSRPEIWRDWDKFMAAVDALVRESAELAEVAQSGDMKAIGAQVKRLGDACGNCHKPFRKPKGESYKRQ